LDLSNLSSNLDLSDSENNNEIGSSLKETFTESEKSIVKKKRNYEQQHIKNQKANIRKKAKREKSRLEKSNQPEQNSNNTEEIEEFPPAKKRIIKSADVSERNITFSKRNKK